MGRQTVDSLIERKLRPWLKKGLITKPQFSDLVAYCVEYGFWEALGRATKTKYQNLALVNSTQPFAVESQSSHIFPKSYPAQGGSRFEFLTVFISKRELQHVDYVTNGSWSSRRQKRHRVWTNGYFFADGTSVPEELKRKYPFHELVRVNRTQGVYTLRRALKD